MQRQNPNQGTNSQPAATILIVEDESMIAFAIKTSLINLGYKVCDIAVESEDAIKKVEVYKPDLILMDINLKDSVDGIETAKKIRLSDDIPIVYLTSLEDDETLERAITTDPSGYVLKPFKKRELRIAIEIGLSKHRIQVELKLSKASFHDVVEKNVEGILVIDKKGIVKFANGTAEQFFGIPRASLIGQKIKFPIEGEEGFELDILRTNGSSGVGELRVVESLWNDKPVYLVSVRDITKRKRNEQELINAKKIAEDLAHAKEQFLAKVNHEIRTPMNAIMGMAHLLKTANHTPKEKNYLNTISQSSENLLVIINDLLDLSKVEAGKFTFEKTEFNLHDLINNLINSLTFKIVEKDIYLNSKIDNAIPPVLVGDPVRLNQIITNLVGNAIKFTEKGGVLIKVNLISKESDHFKIHFAVSDTGIGIPKVKLRKIFQSFIQASDDTNRKYGGTGLGLTIAKQLIELQDGTINVESTVNKGSVFSFELMYKIGDPRKLSTANDNLSTVEFRSLNNVTILLVEDNKINQEVVTDLIKAENENIKLDIAVNGKQAIEKIIDTNYDLVLMDVQMPIMDGYEATIFIRAKLDNSKKNIPIIAMTANATAAEKQHCFDSGMTDYISKPIKPKTLYYAILSAIKPASNNGSVVDEHKQELPNKHLEPNKQERKTDKLFDLSYFELFAKGDEKRVIKYIDIYTTEIASHLKTLIKHHENKAWDNVSRSTHTMKPHFNQISMYELESLVVLLEENAKSNKPDELLINTLVNQIQKKWKITVKALKKEKQKRLALLEPN
ncbi:MAG: response regulator [Bacteroidia bacterium]|nr:response regulator [Bacteroidia bacterium]